MRRSLERRAVFGEHREHELHEEVGGIVGRDAALAHAVGDLADELGGFAVTASAV